MEEFFAGVGKVLIVVLIVIVIALLWTLPTWWAWNFVMPYLFHFKTIGIIQAFALQLVAGSLIKSSLTTK